MRADSTSLILVGIRRRKVMQVNIRNLQTLFMNQVRYEIPLYQRRYVWEQEDQWDPLWEDVRNTSEEFLENGSTSPHFLGAVVLQNQPQSAGNLSVWSVVDGQQRLTTMQLLLDAVQEVLEQRGHKDAAARLEVLVLNNAAFVGDDSDRYFKVWPTLGDQDAFRHTMHNRWTSDKFKSARIVRGHEFFKLQANQWLDEYPEQTEARVYALEHAVTYLLQMVVIDLDPNEEPHVIFETLNARGTPLLQSELIKNMLLYEAGRTGSTNTSKLWSFDDDWWRREVRQGRLVRPRSDIFLNYWLIMRTQKEVAHNNVFRDFRFYGDFDSSASNEKAVKKAEAIADDLCNTGQSFVRMENAEIPEMEVFLYRRGVMQVGVLTPVLLWLVSSNVPEEQLQKGIRTLESYLIRRMVCRMTTKDYNRLFLGLLGELERIGADKAGDTIFEYLRGQDADSRLWPGDKDVEETFISSPLYRLLTRGRLRIVLEAIEVELQTNRAAIQSVPRNLTIEHIMPQAWGENWDLPIDAEDQTQARIDRNRMLHTIGNLTLANNRLNPSLSNRPWSEKSEILRKHFNLFLNKEIVDEPEWNEDKIKERSRHLAQVAIKVWPHADGI